MYKKVYSECEFVTTVVVLGLIFSQWCNALFYFHRFDDLHVRISTIQINLFLHFFFLFILFLLLFIIHFAIFFSLPCIVTKKDYVQFDRRQKYCEMRYRLILHCAWFFTISHVFIYCVCNHNIVHHNSNNHKE